MIITIFIKYLSDYSIPGLRRYYIRFKAPFVGDTSHGNFYNSTVRRDRGYLRRSIKGLVNHSTYDQPESEQNNVDKFIHVVGTIP